MIGSLTGIVEHVGSDSILLHVGIGSVSGVGPASRRSPEATGVGYRVFVLAPILGSAKTGDTLTIYTHLHVREDDLSLFGFRTMRELAFFQLLLQAPGIGPKTAMSVMAIGDVSVLARAIVASDVSLLTQVSGIGKRIAERIVVELKARLEKDHPTLTGRGTTAHADVVSALVGLGYSMSEARDAVRQLPADLTNAEEGIRAALKAIGAPVKK